MFGWIFVQSPSFFSFIFRLLPRLEVRSRDEISWRIMLRWASDHSGTDLFYSFLLNRNKRATTTPIGVHFKLGGPWACDKRERKNGALSVSVLNLLRPIRRVIRRDCMKIEAPRINSSITGASHLFSTSLRESRRIGNYLEAIN